LLAGFPWFKGEDSYPIAAYSEFMPPARLGRKPYGNLDAYLFAEDDPWGWHVTEYEEHHIRLGLGHIGTQLVHALVHLGEGRPAHGISRGKLTDNPYWPPMLAEQAGKLSHEHYVVLMPLALSRTQDDKGRLRWTLFGGSEQGPARAFWRSFFKAPKREMPAEEALQVIRRLLATVYGKSTAELLDLRTAGFRILPEKPDGQARGGAGPLPRWTKPYLWTKGESVRGVKYVLTFRPFGQVPSAVRSAYLAGELHLLPFPGSLVFWGTRGYPDLQRELPLAMQIPLLHSIARHESPLGIRVPQSGWLHEPKAGGPEPGQRYGPVRNSFQRTHRWARVHRHEDELVSAKEDRLAHVLFSAAPDDVGLYGKPMARNAQIWTHDFHLLLDGPGASREELREAARKVAEGGLFGYRFVYPALQIGRHEVYWHRPLVAFRSPQTNEPVQVLDLLMGYLTAYPGAEAPRSPESPPSRRGLRLDRPVELWPRLLLREPHLAGLRLFDHQHDPHPYRTSLNVRKLLNAASYFPRGLPISFARQLLSLPKHEPLTCWLDSLQGRAADPLRGQCLVEEIRQVLEPQTKKSSVVPKARTFAKTARRSFEARYWQLIADLSTGKFRTKDNADCVDDPCTRARLPHHHRDLEALGDHLLNYYTRLIARQRMTGKALAGDMPFCWQTDFDYTWSKGWQSNRTGAPAERDLVVVIPGRDRRRAVIMADHYDTAYMEDCYEKSRGGTGARLAAAGADDNHSATAALMLGAESFLELSRARQLACDIWLVHLTGEEFPADCLGARNLCQRLVEGTLALRLPDDSRHDLARVCIQGVYVLDMVAHNNDHDRDVFQITPGTGPTSMWLAYQAHLANEMWNASVPSWNRRSSRRGCQRGQRSPDGSLPAVALHPHLWGEVRPPYDPRSTLFNTDGQIFSDAGIPVVLFMENYDINRVGYHDTHDTLANIDLDYGAAVAAIAIESVARAASEKPPR
jgi:Peptidase family M28